MQKHNFAESGRSTEQSMHPSKAYVNAMSTVMSSQTFDKNGKGEPPLHTNRNHLPSRGKIIT